MIEIYTDGSARSNPGPGGFGAVVVQDGQIIKTYSKQFLTEQVTNNQMEIKAILWAFFNYGIKIHDVFQPEIPVVYSDSAYCVNTFNDWMFFWERNGWTKSDNKKPENLELIQAYYDWWKKGYRIELRKVKGHAGNEYNELADRLATGREQATSF